MCDRCDAILDNASEAFEATSDEVVEWLLVQYHEWWEGRDHAVQRGEEVDDVEDDAAHAMMLALIDGRCDELGWPSGVTGHTLPPLLGPSLN